MQSAGFRTTNSSWLLHSLFTNMQNFLFASWAFFASGSHRIANFSSSKTWKANFKFILLVLHANNMIPRFLVWHISLSCYHWIQHRRLQLQIQHSPITPPKMLSNWYIILFKKKKKAISLWIKMLKLKKIILYDVSMAKFWLSVCWTVHYHFPCTSKIMYKLMVTRHF